MYLFLINLDIFNNTRVTPQSLRDITNYMKENQELIHLNPPVRIFGDIGLIQGDLWIREGSIRDNITLDLDFDRTKYEKLSKLLNLEAIFLKFEDSDNSFNIRNLNFSEKFMINLARALYRHTSILLIEDILWKLEDYWKLLVVKSLILEEFSHLTWIIITHDIELLQKSSKIVHMTGKLIAGVGTFEELKKKKLFGELKE